ncbi:2Fe-2S ferredoxin [Devosia limi DSM 17137]|uniref:2Fe-2S ferredoxin n=1 Tax=Devosia limi DSM 17137 TaxID=1121477 RepID=A0A0F5LPR6_9HYPH|nr:DUF1284 domain-containing protein [Devosia limi]KKB84119.1 2Fe-2S ferredoxin [Devosia limi DSM 17137]SHF91962.1 hypothetical protein SAMN02745223_03894 [Devosia limi DSM 17137]
MTLRLRAHHLLCMLTYVGKGYTPAFTANYDVMIRRLNGGEDILLVDGPDDICAPLLVEADPHCWRDSVIERDRHALQALTQLLARPLRAGTCIVLDSHHLAIMRAAFASGETRTACGGCEWAGLCTTIAGNDFGGARLQIATADGP